MNFVCHCKCLLVPAFAALMMFFLSGCGGVNAGGGASPATFFIPGVAGYDGVREEDPSHMNVSDDPGIEAMGAKGTAIFKAMPFYLQNETDPS